MILRNGGTIYVDTGKPVPGLIERTVANLVEVSPTIYFNVPRGFSELLSYMEKDRSAGQLLLRNWICSSTRRRRCRSRYGRSWRSCPLRLEGCGCRWPLPGARPKRRQWQPSSTLPSSMAGVIGLPAPGTELKFVPSGSKLEMRVRGPNVTPGYYQRDDLTEAAFDEDGFYRIGDAGKLVNPAEPARGVVFDGRTAEDFKLASGNWVHVGWLRVAAIATAPSVIQDVVVTGHDRDEVGLLIFPSLNGIITLAEDASDDATLADLVAREDVREAVRCRLAAHNRDHTRISTRIGRALLLVQPPAIDANEVTDKGYINQLAVLECRADLVKRLYSGGPEVIIVD